METVSRATTPSPLQVEQVESGRQPHALISANHIQPISILDAPETPAYWTRSFSSTNQANSGVGASLNNPSTQINELDYLRQQVKRANALALEERFLRQAAEAGKMAAEAHCAIQTSRINDLQDRLNVATSKRQRTQTRRRGQVLTAPEAKEEYYIERTQKEAKARETNAMQQAKQAAARAREVERARKATTESYENPLHSYNSKDQLKDIAYALGLELSGTIKDLLQRIRDCMSEKRSELEKDHRFKGLFAVRKQSKRSTNERIVGASDFSSDSNIQGDDGQESVSGTAAHSDNCETVH
ncbi:hypothetical protein M422DRAFT_45665 [Sphaerobolus stellatus SS14]|nr:hypothetical protein M422DRAFT_45665 [Sphaerobolus stellatus SS14]